MGIRVSAVVTLLCVAAVAVPHAQQPQPTAAVVAAVPRVMWLSGVFRPATTQPIAAVESVTVTIYRERDGGDALWQETQSVAMEPGGRYNLLIGATSADGLPLELFTSGEPRWIGITVNRPGEVEQPRVPLASVPYALKAADADTLGGLPASAYLRADAPASRSSAGASPQTSGQATAEDVTVLTAGTPGYLGLFTDSANLGNSVLFQNGSAIALGTTVPRDMFHVSFTDGGGTLTGYGVQNLSSAPSAYSGMLFYDQNNTLGLFQGFNNVSHEYRINNVAPGGSINFRIGSSSKFLVANNGNIGIGVPAPAWKLEVAGDISTTTHYRIGAGRVLSASGTSTYAGLIAGGSSTGADNTFVGYDAGSINTIGARNSILGTGAGSGSMAGDNNAYFGYQAGIAEDGSSGNAYFGSFSGNSTASFGNNTLLGFGTQLGIAALTNATAIGYRAMVSQSNSLVLGSINGQNGAESDTNVGIGTQTPKTKLHVAGGSVYIAQPNSLVITSPNGNCWFITVNDAGALGSILITCP